MQRSEKSRLQIYSINLESFLSVNLWPAFLAILLLFVHLFEQKMMGLWWFLSFSLMAFFTFIEKVFVGWALVVNELNKDWGSDASRQVKKQIFPILFLIFYDSRITSHGVRRCMSWVFVVNILTCKGTFYVINLVVWWLIIQQIYWAAHGVHYNAGHKIWST